MDIRLASLMIISKVWQDDNTDINYNGSKRKVLSDKTTLNRSQEFLNEAKSCFGNNTEFSFGSLGVRFVQKSAIWDKVWGTWNKPDGESIVIVLPSFPDNSADLLSGVMAYYSQFPTIFGQNFPDPEKPDDGVLKTYALFSSGGAVIPANNYDLGVATGPFLSLSAVLSKVIVEAHKDQKFKDDVSLSSAVYNSDLDSVRYFNKINMILSRRFQFENPWALGLGFVFAAKDKAEYEGRDGQYFKSLEELLEVNLSPFPSGVRGIDLDVKSVKSRIRAMVNLDLPAKPDNEADFAAALVDYNCIGPKYPFTCS